MFRHDTCRHTRDLLPLHVGGDLPPAKAARVDEHLHHCLPCFREFRELTTMREHLGVLIEQPLPEGALDGFTEEVMARITVDEAGPRAPLPAAAASGGWTDPRMWSRYAAAAAVVLGLGLALQSLDAWSPQPAAPAAAPGFAMQSDDLVAAGPESAPSQAESLSDEGGFPLPVEGPQRRTAMRPPNFNTQVVSGFSGRIEPVLRENPSSSMSDMQRSLLDAAGAQAFLALRHGSGLVPEPGRVLRPRDQR